MKRTGNCKEVKKTLNNWERKYKKYLMRSPSRYEHCVTSALKDCKSIDIVLSSQTVSQICIQIHYLIVNGVVLWRRDVAFFDTYLPTPINMISKFHDISKLIKRWILCLEDLWFFQRPKVYKCAKGRQEAHYPWSLDESSLRHNQTPLSLSEWLEIPEKRTKS